MSQIEEAKSALALICGEADVPKDGTVVTRLLGGKTIALSRSNGREKEIVAFSNRCPHMSAPLRFGRVVNGEIICPWHFFRFDTETGKTVGCESIMKLEVYRVEVVDGNVYVGLE
jgi:nitrite reductase/ring-hydroxylating ferredoxin subunit